MVSCLRSFLDKKPSSPPRFGRTSAKLLGPRLLLTLIFTLKQTEWMSKELEYRYTLRCLCYSDPSSLSSQLSWIDYAQNTHFLFSFCGFSWILPMFRSEEMEVAVTSIRHHIHKGKRTWSNIITVLNHTAEQNLHMVDCSKRLSAAHLVWLSTKDINIKASSRKLSIWDPVHHYPHFGTTSYPQIWRFTQFFMLLYLDLYWTGLSI